jgi:hypothetical protein
MFTLGFLSRSLAACCLVVVGACGLAAHADENSVKANEATLRTVGNQRLIAFYEPGGGNCALNIVMWNVADESGDSPTRVRVSLDADQAAYIDSTDKASVKLQCDHSADTLKIIDDTPVPSE